MINTRMTVNSNNSSLVLLGFQSTPITVTSYSYTLYNLTFVSKGQTLWLIRMMNLIYEKLTKTSARSVTCTIS